MTSRAEVGELLRQTAWIRSLARSLVADLPLPDGHVADDLVQDTWVAALARPPAVGHPLRGWLATVLRNRLRELVRERGRRRQREEAAARHEALPSVHEVVEKAALQRSLVEAVLELDEPYRTTVLLRFFEELPQREIARRMQTSTATVNSRLTRALEKLREKLSRGSGLEPWFHVLLPLLREPSLAPVALGVGAMKLSLAVVLVVVSIVVGIVLWRPGSEPALATASAPVLAQAPAAIEPAGAPSAALADSVPGPARRAETEERPETPPASAPDVPPAAPRILRGRVVDVSGVALSGVELALALREHAEPLEGGPRCTSGSGGWFELPSRPPADIIVSADPRQATVLAGWAEVRGDTEPLVVVAPRVRVAGLVVDSNGAPLQGALLDLQLPDGFGTEWGLVSDYSLPQRWRARSDEDGRFEFESMPAIRDAALRATLGGYDVHVEPAPLQSDTRLVVILEHPQSDHALVRGVVLDPLGAPVEGARVSARAEVAYTGRDGAFALDVSRPGTRPPLIALKRGFEPAQFAPPPGAEGEPDWPRSLVLRLGQRPSAIHGRVVDEDHRPVDGARVWLDDPTPFGLLGHDSVAAESLLRGDERFWGFELTAADGSFRIDGLLPRTYRLQAVDPVMLASGELGPVGAADSPVEIVLRTHDVYERVAGQVVTRGGRPVEGAMVQLLRITYEVKLAEGKQNQGMSRPPVFTNEDGEFEFRAVPEQGVDLLVTGDTILFTGVRLAQEHDVEDIVMVVTQRLHLQVELDPPHSRVDQMRVLDADGVPVVLNVMQGEGSFHGPEMPVLDGHSAVITVDDAAATLVLLREGKEVARLPLALAPGEPNVVRY